MLISPLTLSGNATYKKGEESLLPLQTDTVFHYQYNTGVTTTGSGVANWKNLLGNGIPVTQMVDSKRAINTAGDITFDGINDNLNALFTFVQPFTIYLRLRANAVIDNRYFLGGAVVNTARLIMRDFPEIASFYAFYGATLGLGPNSVVSGVFATIVIVGNGASSLVQKDSGVPVTGNLGANNPNGIWLGEAGANNGANSPVTYREAAGYSVAHNSTEIATTVAYFNGI